jgi:hypothetical protein
MPWPQTLASPLLSLNSLAEFVLLAGRVLAFGPTIQKPYKCAAGFCEQDYAHTAYVSRKRKACKECWDVVVGDE